MTTAEKFTEENAVYGIGQHVFGKFYGRETSAEIIAIAEGEYTIDIDGVEYTGITDRDIDGIDD